MHILACSPHSFLNALLFGRLSPDDCLDRLQPPRDPTDGLSGYRKWMDGRF